MGAFFTVVAAIIILVPLALGMELIAFLHEYMWQASFLFWGIIITFCILVGRKEKNEHDTMNEKQFYEIRLEDYSFPRYSSAIKSYYGTREDINRLIAYLKDDNHLRVRYSETIQAVESYDGTNVPVHNVAGQIFPILTPAEEVCRFETQLADQSWNYVNPQDESYPCKASTVDICQNLIRTENGYERCLKANTFGICISYQGHGWVCSNGVLKGFPGIVTFHDNFRHSMNLFVSQAHYGFDEFAQAMADTVNTDRIDLTALAADIVGGW